MKEILKLDLLEINLKKRLKEFYEKFIEEDQELTLKEKEYIIAMVVYDLIEETLDKKVGSNKKLKKEKKEEYKARLLKIWNNFRKEYEKNDSKVSLVKNRTE